MKRILITLLMLFATMSFSGHHEASENQIIFTINADIVEGKADSFKALLKEMVPAVKASEPDTTRYQYFMSPDNKKLTLIEVYPNNEAALFHMTAFAVSPFGEEFLASIIITSFVIAGNASPELMKSVEPFTSDNRPPVQGFIR
jgi:quinol monooxygenase YgiN